MASSESSPNMTNPPRKLNKSLCSPTRKRKNLLRSVKSFFKKKLPSRHSSNLGSHRNTVNPQPEPVLDSATQTAESSAKKSSHNSEYDSGRSVVSKKIRGVLYSEKRYSKSGRKKRLADNAHVSNSCPEPVSNCVADSTVSHLHSSLNHQQVSVRARSGDKNVLPPTVGTYGNHGYKDPLTTQANSRQPKKSFRHEKALDRCQKKSDLSDKLQSKIRSKVCQLPPSRSLSQDVTNSETDEELTTRNLGKILPRSFRWPALLALVVLAIAVIITMGKPVFGSAFYSKITQTLVAELKFPWFLSDRVLTFILVMVLCGAVFYMIKLYAVVLHHRRGKQHGHSVAKDAKKSRSSKTMTSTTTAAPSAGVAHANSAQALLGLLMGIACLFSALRTITRVAEYFMSGLECFNRHTQPSSILRRLLRKETKPASLKSSASSTGNLESASTDASQAARNSSGSKAFQPSAGLVILMIFLPFIIPLVYFKNVKKKKLTASSPGQTTAPVAAGDDVISGGNSAGRSQGEGSVISRIVRRSIASSLRGSRSAQQGEHQPHRSSHYLRPIKSSSVVRLSSGAPQSSANSSKITCVVC